MADLPDPKVGCHHTGFTKKCRKLVVDGVCNRWVHFIGSDPNTGVAFDHSNCIDNWLLKVGLEGAQMSRQTGAAVESFRNEMVRQNMMLLEAAQQPPILAVTDNRDEQ